MDWFADVNRTGKFPVSFHGGIVFKRLVGMDRNFMQRLIVDSPLPITLVGGGDSTSAEVDEALGLAPCLVAADGGVAAALAAGHMPQAVIGDMDSVPDAVRTRLPPHCLHRITEQDTTDFDKALRSIRAPFVLGLGFLGARLDHQLANLTVLVRHPEAACLLVGAEDVVLAIPPQRELALDLAPGMRVSLYPLAPVRGTSEGLHWPVDGLDFAPDARVGTSNRVAATHDGAVRLRFAAPGMLLILPRSALRAALAALVPASG